MADDHRPLLTETSFRVRFAETDQMGVVHHAAYVVYLEEGRSELSRRWGAPYSALEDAGFSLALSDVAVHYVSSARYDDLITVRAWVDALRSRSITFGYEVVDAATQRLLVTGSTRHICVNRQGEVRRIPETWVAPLKAAGGW